MSKTASQIVDRALTLIDEVPTEFATAATTETSIRNMALEILPDLCRDLVKELPWDLKRYLAKTPEPTSYDISSEINAPGGIVILNGKMYIIDAGTKILYRYSVGANDNVTYDGYSYDLTNEDPHPEDIAVYDGKIYICGWGNGDTVYRYSVDSLGDLTYDSFTIDVSSEVNVVEGISFYNDKMYISDVTTSGVTAYVYRYTIDVSGNASYDNYNIDVTAIASRGPKIGSDNGKLYLSSGEDSVLATYDIDPTSYDLSYDNTKNFPVADGSISGVFAGGGKIYTTGRLESHVLLFNTDGDGNIVLSVVIDELTNGESQDNYFKQKVSFKAPDDFWELVSIRLSVWAKPVVNYIYINGNEYGQQNNPFTRGGKQNPVVALNNTTESSNLRIECFSINKGDANTVDVFEYISFDNVPDDSGNTWPDEIFDEVTKALATQLNIIKGRVEEGSIMGSEVEGAIEQHE